MLYRIHPRRICIAKDLLYNETANCQTSEMEHTMFHQCVSPHVTFHVCCKDCTKMTRQFSLY